MRRWRLRFNLQEIDLPIGRVVLGRAAECPITLDDPLISRRHAEILVTETGCVLMDLGSRNGVRLNGNRIDAPTTLAANDRIRLGRDELVLLSGEDAGAPSMRVTATLVACKSCGQEHAGGAPACPRCGARRSALKVASA